MNKKQKNIIIGMGILLTLSLLLTGKKFVAVLKSFLPKVEGFSPVPIWDFKQWSWGYGTAAGFDPNKKPAGTITPAKAWTDAEKYIQNHYSILSPLVKKKLNDNQWAALLSFSYNAGTGNAKNIVQTINSGTPADVVARMKKYVYAGGKYNQGLANRRQKETDLYQGFTSYAARISDAPAERIHPDLVGEVAY